MVTPSAVPSTLDALLFVDGPVVLIDRMNRSTGRVAGLAEAEAALARGEAATYAAQLHPAITGLDLDVDDARLADYLVEELTGWADRRQLWHVTRESGGGPGRRHLFIVAGRHSNDLVDLIHLLRHERRLTGRQLDVRTVIRPLSAPHRQSGRRNALNLSDARVLELSKSLSQHQITRSAAAGPRRGRQRRVREPEPTLLTGQVRRILASVKRSDDRSADEFSITRKLRTAGTDEATSWSAMRYLNGHSAARGFTWWHTYIWSAIRPAESVRQPRSVDIRPLILPTFAAIRPLYGDLDTRRRHSLETVAWAILERLTGQPDKEWVPLSRRDLELVTGLSRSTITGALAWLVDHAVVERRCADRRDDADSWRTGSAAARGTGSLIDPPLLTPPASTWAPSSPAGTATAAADFHQQTTRPPGSPRQQALRTAQLTAAQAAGLTGTERTKPVDTTAWTERLARITAERDQFHSAIRQHRQRRQEEWNRQRCAVLRRNRDRQRQWWRSLTAAERAERRRRCQRRFRTLDSTDRTLLHRRLSSRRRTLDEANLHHAEPSQSYALNASSTAGEEAFLPPRPSPECDSGVNVCLTSPNLSGKISTTHDEKRVIGGGNQTGQGWSDRHEEGPGESGR